ncbi:5887_t:CDS:2, partial [Scutellospora calospora]
MPHIVAIAGFPDVKSPSNHSRSDCLVALVFSCKDYTEKFVT